MNAALTELLNDNEYELVVEAMVALREKKIAALHEAKQHPATQSFTARDFGVPQIDALLTRLDAKVPMDEADAVTSAVLANCNVRIPLKGDEASPSRNDRELLHQMRTELLWINEEVWPLVHGLNSREVVKNRFKRLPDLINATAPLPAVDTPVNQARASTPVNWPSWLALAGMAREVWGNPIPKEAHRFAEALRKSVDRLNAAPVGVVTVSPPCQSFAGIVTEPHVQAAAESAWRKQHLGAEYADASQQTKWHWEEIAREVFRHSPAAPAAEIGIRLEGGVIQSIWGNQPVNVLVVDYDTEGRPDDELFDLPQDGGGTSECAIEEFSAVVMPDENERIRSSRVAREPEGPRP